MKVFAPQCLVCVVTLGHELETTVNFTRGRSILGILLESAVTAALCEAVGVCTLICVE